MNDSIVVPRKALQTKELTPQTCIVLSFLAQSSTCLADNRELGEALALDRTRISRVIQALSDKGYIGVEYNRAMRGMSHSRMIRLTPKAKELFA